MSIIISGIDMPTNCTQCPCSDDGARFCSAANEFIPTLGKPNFCPLVEAEERKSGKWIYIRTEESGNGLYQCSVCSKGDIHAPEVEVSYCWNCGAKMGTSHE